MKTSGAICLGKTWKRSRDPRYRNGSSGPITNVPLMPRSPSLGINHLLLICRLWALGSAGCWETSAFACASLLMACHWTSASVIFIAMERHRPWQWCSDPWISSPDRLVFDMATTVYYSSARSTQIASLDDENSRARDPPVDDYY